MKRFAIALAVLLTATVSPAFAGYIIIRVLLESAGGDTGSPSGSGGPSGGMSLPGYGGRPGGSGSMGGMPGGGKTGPMPGFPGSKPGTAASTNPTEFDHKRSVVVVIPLEADLPEEKLDKTKAANDKNNPRFRKFVVPYYGKKLHAPLFVDSTSIQLYQELIAKPAPKKTLHTMIVDKYTQWLKDKNPQTLYDALVLALESGSIRELAVPVEGGPPKDAATFAQELLDLAADNKPLPPTVDRFVKTWGAMSKAVRGPAQQASNAESWKERLDARDVRVDGHYALVYWDSSSTEVTRRLKQLNDNFLAFYLWHATRGEALPVPPKPLVAVLAKQGQAMRGLYHALDGLPVHADAFYAPDHDLLVLSPERLDSIGQTFMQQTQQLFGKGLTRDQLLDGLFPKLDSTGEKGANPNDVARATMLAVVEKLVVDEAEIAAISHEGTRQLLFATGQLPNHVTLPNWLTSGAVSYLARPRGPAYVTKGDEDKPYMHVAVTTGYGVPNYVLRRYFRDLDEHKELNADRALLLEHVLTDAYFTGIKDADDPDPAPPAKKKKTGTEPAPPPKTGPGAGGSFNPPGGGPKAPGGSSGGPPVMPKGPGGFGPMGGTGATATGADEEDPAIALRKKRERLTIKAEATAWALYYYLAREKPELLQKYIAELNKLPRDLPIDGRTAFGTFVRVFGLTTADGHTDQAKLKAFANAWFESTGSLRSVGEDIPLVVPDPPKEQTNPMGPKGPGGSGSPPGPRP